MGRLGGAPYLGGSTNQGSTTMAEQITLNSGSPQRVAYDIWLKLFSALPKEKAGLERIEHLLKLYTQCLNATMDQTVDVKKLS
jgi:hypothetical protein